MELPTSKRDILARIARSYAAWQDVVSALTAEQMLAPRAAGEWSARDVAAHVAADEQWLAGQLSAFLNGELPTSLACYGTEFEQAPPGIDLATQDGRNAWQYERLRHLSLEDVRDLAAQSHPNLIALLQAVPDGVFETPFAMANHGVVGHIRPAAPGEAGFPFWRWAAGATYLHYEDHAAALSPPAEGHGA